MRLRIAIAVATMIAALVGTAQSSEDALKYTYYEFGGTARYNSMAGAFGALGGDLSSVHVNPAGLGVYRSSELTFSPNLIVNGADASFLGTSNDDSRVAFNIDNIGLVMAYPMDKGNWKFGQFALSYTRLKDFQNNYTISGENAESTFLEIAAIQAQDFNPGDLGEGTEGFTAYPAYNTYLINPYYDSEGEFIEGYVEAIPYDSLKEQITDLQTRGKISETSFSGAMNYNDRLYIGFGFGFQRFVDEQRSTYTENVLSDIPETFSTDTTLSRLDSFTYSERYDLRGNGFNLRVGAIYKIMDEVRVGLSYRSPTWSTMETTYETEFSSIFEDGRTYTQEGAQIGANSFNLTSPHRLNASLGLVLGKKAILSADYERVDYRNAQLRGSNSGASIDFREDNERTERILEDGQNIRVGLEYRVKPFSLRVGTAMYSNPYRNVDVENHEPTMFYTGGVGYRGERSYIDLGYRLRTYSSDYYAYDPTIQPAATIDHTDHSITLTFGTRF